MLANRLTTILLIAAVTVLGVHVADRALVSARADVTEDDLYSLTSGTVDILRRMEEEGVQPITLELYFSETVGKTLPRFVKDFMTYERYLRALLGEYERAARGKIEVRFVDPVPDSDAAQNALDFGLDGKPVNQHGDLFFFGLVVETRTGGREVIEFLWPEQQESVEYEITKRIHSLLWPAGKRIGVLAGLEVMGSSDNPYMAQMLAAQGRQPREKWLAMRLMEETYPVVRIDPDVESISRDDVDLVVVVHPKGLSEKARWALDEWIVKGGNALVFVDPYALDDQPPPNPREPWAALQYPRSSNLDALFGAWGLARPANRIAADLALAVQRPLSRRGPAESVVVDLALEGNDLAVGEGRHPVLLGLDRVRMLLAGVLETGELAEGLEATTLLATTESGGRLTIEPGIGGREGLYYTDLGDGAKLRSALEPTEGREPLAVLLSGRFPTAYPEGAELAASTPEPPPGWPPGVPPPAPEDAETVRREPVPEEERSEANVAVFADVDLISDQIAFQRNFLGIVQTPNDNHKLLMNTVDFLLGSGELMNVRAKGRVHRPFTLFDRIEAEAEKETLERERQIRGEIEGFEEELRAKQSEITQRDAALYQRKLQQEVDRLNERIQEGNRELREIRRERRAALASEEARVWRSVLGWMPLLVLIVGIAMGVRRRRSQQRATGGS